MTEMPANAVLQIRNARKHYGAVRALDGVDLDIGDGEFLTLLGPSGSGKTTLLMAIAGFTDLDEGQIILRGDDIITPPPDQRNFGMVFQGYALFPTMTVGKNIAFPLKVRKWSKSDIADRVRECLSLVQMEDYADRMPSQLSGGQQQRIALARALAFRPSVLLPFAVLPLMANMKGINRAYVDAARGLGASEWTAFTQVYFPQTKPGVMSAALLVFVLSLGFYITPALLGGGRVLMISEYITYQIQEFLKWGVGSMLSVTLLVATAIVLLAASRFINLRQTFLERR